MLGARRLDGGPGGRLGPVRPPPKAPPEAPRTAARGVRTKLMPSGRRAHGGQPLGSSWRRKGLGRAGSSFEIEQLIKNKNKKQLGSLSTTLAINDLPCVMI